MKKKKEEKMDAPPNFDPLDEFSFGDYPFGVDHLDYPPFGVDPLDDPPFGGEAEFKKPKVSKTKKKVEKKKPVIEVQRVKILVSILYNLIYTYKENKLWEKIGDDCKNKVQQWTKACFGKITDKIKPTEDPENPDPIEEYYYEFLERTPIPTQFPFKLLVTSPYIIQNEAVFKDLIGGFSLMIVNTPTLKFNNYTDKIPSIPYIRVGVEITNYLMEMRTGCKIETTNFSLSVTNPDVFYEWITNHQKFISPKTIKMRDILIYCTRMMDISKADLVAVLRKHKKTGRKELSYHIKKQGKKQLEKNTNLSFFWYKPSSEDLKKKEIEIPVVKGYEIISVQKNESVNINSYMICASCGISADNMFVCGDCQNQVYCGKRCQKMDWQKRHAQECKEK